MIPPVDHDLIDLRILHIRLQQIQFFPHRIENAVDDRNLVLEIHPLSAGTVKYIFFDETAYLFIGFISGAADIPADFI